MSKFLSQVFLQPFSKAMFHVSNYVGENVCILQLVLFGKYIEKSEKLPLASINKQVEQTSKWKNG